MNSYLLNYGLLFLGLIITVVADVYVRSSYSKYKKIDNKKGLSGFEVARHILDKNGLKDVHVVEVSGELTDHYDPSRKVVRLSEPIFNGTSIASVSVAAHECGHAIQDSDKYAFMRIRSKLVPAVNFSSKFGYIAIMIGLIFGFLKIAIFGIALLLVMLLFQLVTLPVEFDASRRGKLELDKMHALDDSELKFSANMLRAAAFTYVASLVTTLLEILRLALIAFSREK